MPRLQLKDVTARGWLKCPECGLQFSSVEVEEKLVCLGCGKTYVVHANIPCLLPGYDEPNKSEIQDFWKDLYSAAYCSAESTVDEQTLQDLMPQLDELLRHRQHLAAVEACPETIAGKTVLEVGSGAGAHSAYFKWLGANVVAMDLTLERVAATARKLETVEGSGEYFCVHADAENLPFEDDIFDLVYSNGVLHHTPETRTAIEEIRRVLKPGGQAAIMLYARHSFYYWVVLFLLKGILLGERFRSKQWLGHVTEWMSNEPQTRPNPETKVFTKLEVLRLFRQFSSVRVRKNSFAIQQIPLIGPMSSTLLFRGQRINEAGRLLYGVPWRHESRWELHLGNWIGFALNIQATK